MSDDINLRALLVKFIRALSEAEGVGVDYVVSNGSDVNFTSKERALLASLELEGEKDRHD